MWKSTDPDILVCLLILLAGWSAYPEPLERTIGHKATKKTVAYQHVAQRCAGVELFLGSCFHRAEYGRLHIAWGLGFSSSS